MDNHAARMILDRLSASFPRFPLQERTIKLWSNALERFDYSSAEHAVEQLAIMWRDDHIPPLGVLVAEIMEAQRGAAREPVGPAEEMPPEVVTMLADYRSRHPSVPDEIKTTIPGWEIPERPPKPDPEPVEFDANEVERRRTAARVAREQIEQGTDAS